MQHMHTEPKLLRSNHTKPHGFVYMRTTADNPLWNKLSEIMDDPRPNGGRSADHRTPRSAAHQSTVDGPKPKGGRFAGDTHREPTERKHNTNSPGVDGPPTTRRQSAITEKPETNQKLATSQTQLRVVNYLSPHLRNTWDDLHVVSQLFICRSSS